MTSFTDVLLLFNTDSNTLEKVWDEVECIIDGEEFDDWSDDKTVKISDLITQAQDEDDEQYKCKCPECDRTLGRNVDIMCYSNQEKGDRTLCNDCYWDCGYYEDDENSDNEEEITEFLCEDDEQ